VPTIGANGREPVGKPFTVFDDATTAYLGDDEDIFA
jgi:hypothetical protein